MTNIVRNDLCDEMTWVRNDPGTKWLEMKCVQVVAICEGNSMWLHTAASWYLSLPRMTIGRWRAPLYSKHAATRAEIALYRTRSHDGRTMSY